MSEEEKDSWTPEETRAMRRRLGASQEEFARLLGVRQQTVSDWETGAHAPQGASRRLLELIAGAPGLAYGAGAAWGLLLRAAERWAPYGGDSAGGARLGANSSGEAGAEGGMGGDSGAEGMARAEERAGEEAGG